MVEIIFATYIQLPGYALDWIKIKVQVQKLLMRCIVVMEEMLVKLYLSFD